jgi:hypothetical protein
MSKHLKIVLLKTLIFMIIIGLWNYWISRNYIEFNKELKSIMIQTLGTGFLFGITIYFFDKPEKKEESDK